LTTEPTIGRLARALLLARTLPRLRWQQLAYPPLRRLQQRLPLRLPELAASPQPAHFAVLAGAAAAWEPDSSETTVARAERIVAGRFTFLNHTEHLPRIDWRARHGTRLWSFHLHEFDYALDLARAWRSTSQPRFAAAFAGLTESWIAGNPPATGDGWEPYTISVRSVNWLLARLLFGAALAPATSEAVDRSVHQQLGLLERRLEYHILGNHLLRNLTALAVGGLYFDYEASRRWRATALPQLWHELPEQVLPDGCHAERSPLYHALALADLLRLIDLCDVVAEPVPAAARDRVAAMARALAILSRPDGSLHLFNDAADGTAPSPVWLRQLAVRVAAAEPAAPQGRVALPHAGYWGWFDDARGERFIIDCGPPGPDHLQGHAHCDMLSYELDLGGQRIICDSGVSGYEGDPLRSYVRSTRAHNTVTIDGREQSEVWGSFGMARRGAPVFATHSAESEPYQFRGGCTPYHSRRAVHQREVRRLEGNWTITDRVQGGEGRRLDSCIHFHPACTVQREGDGFLVSAAGVRLRIETFGIDVVTVHQGEESPAQGWYCPEFGSALPAPVLRLTVNANDGREFGYWLVRS
jgi:hypothetical protein